MLSLLISAWILGATVSDADRQRFIDACTGNTNLGGAVCGCLADKAAARFSDDGFEFLIHMIGKSDQVDAARARLPMGEVMKAGMFMVNTPAECAREEGPGS